MVSLCRTMNNYYRNEHFLLIGQFYTIDCREKHDPSLKAPSHTSVLHSLHTSECKVGLHRVIKVI